MLYHETDDKKDVWIQAMYNASFPCLDILTIQNYIEFVISNHAVDMFIYVVTAHLSTVYCRPPKMNKK